ncbi:hypothetical protein [cf. Phormidesmis sp. LEGE 11477]|nr:hypothetical protein [cf. Phormidesmis sp. LEGE 11477]
MPIVGGDRVVRETTPTGRGCRYSVEVRFLGMMNNENPTDE